MKDERDVYPICGSQITDKIIDYSDWSVVKLELVA
jgi:hypothetical protein